MNILVICHYGLYQDLSFSFVHNQIREFVKLGHRVRVVVPNGLGKVGRDGKRIGKLLQKSCVDGVELYDLRYITASRFGEKRFNTQSAIAAIHMFWKDLIEDFMPNVIHAHTLGFDSDIGAWLKERLGCPLVVTSHGSDVVLPLESGKHNLLRSTCGKAEVIVAVSSALRKKLQICSIEVPIEVISNGFVFREPKTDIIRDPYRMIQVGNLVASKRVNNTIQAFARLKKQHREMNLTVIGQGPERTVLEQLCEQLGVSDSVTFKGQLENSFVFEELCKSSYFVMVSKPEGFGIVYLEAMAAGCAAIGTEGEGIADLINHGENGFLLPADDPEAIVRTIEWCISNPEAAAAIAKKGSDSARALTWQNNAQMYMQLFDRLSNEEISR